jgi:hypothetical protein
MRSDGPDDNIDSFDSKEQAVKYIAENAYIFGKNEIVAIVDFFNRNTTFIKFEAQIVPVLIE